MHFPARLSAVLGATNTGKTRLAIERMLGCASGMMGLPLRLLAREVYELVVAAKGARAVALLTGEERIAPETARYFICTTEAMPWARQTDFVALDEIQLARDPERGYIFTQNLLALRGRTETLWLGAGHMRAVIAQLFPDAEIESRERFSTLSYSGPMKLTRLPRRSVVVAFSAEEVYAIAELIRRYRGGAAIVMGGLSPRTRNAQVALYQNQEVDFLVATDAIGMGLNMDVDHVAFASLTKFDGKRRRRLNPDEMAQIAGRAGRFRSDGTFGETSDCPIFEPEWVERIENHQFDATQYLEWRNPDLDFSSLTGLLHSLQMPAPGPQFRRCDPATDERTLGMLAEQSEFQGASWSREAVERLWAIAQIPDFRKSGADAHFRLVRSLARPLLHPPFHLAPEWIDAQIQSLLSVEGEIDALQARLAHIRTLAYIANRPDWVRDPMTLRARTRELEDRLSDALHDRLMQRFVDRRTAALLHGLQRNETLIAQIGTDQSVRVEGHYVGQLRGLQLDQVPSALGLAEKAMRHAAERALRPEIARRLGEIARATTFELKPNGDLAWQGLLVARLSMRAAKAGAPCPDHDHDWNRYDWLNPKVELIGGQLGTPESRARAVQNIETWLETQIKERLACLDKLRDGLASGKIKGLARGIFFQLLTHHGAILRSRIEPEIRALSQAERRILSRSGIRIGALCVYVQGLLAPKTQEFLRILLGAGGAAELPSHLHNDTPIDTNIAPLFAFAMDFTPVTRQDPSNRTQSKTTPRIRIIPFEILEAQIGRLREIERARSGQALRASSPNPDPASDPAADPAPAGAQKRPGFAISAARLSEWARPLRANANETLLILRLCGYRLDERQSEHLAGPNLTADGDLWLSRHRPKPRDLDILIGFHSRSRVADSESTSPARARGRGDSPFAILQNLTFERGEPPAGPKSRRKPRPKSSSIRRRRNRSQTVRVRE